MSSVMQARMLVVSAALLFSLGGLGIKFCSFGPWQTAAFRSFFAGAAILLVLKDARRCFSWRVLLPGAALAATLILFVWGNKTTTAANTIFIQSSAPLWILLLSPLLLKEGIYLRDVGTMLVMGLGLVLFFFAPERATNLSPRIALGNSLALVSGVAYAFAVMGLRGLRDRGAESALVTANALVFLVGSVLMLSSGTFTAGSRRDWLVVGFLGCFQIGLAYVLYARGLRVLRATQSSLIALIEPVLNPIWVFLVFRSERPGPQAVLGGVLILAAAVYRTLSRRGE